jgi:hypothetical protein
VLFREADRGGRPVLRLGHRQLDRYLEFVAARARPNTVSATGYDLKVFFEVVSKVSAEVTASDVLGFIPARRDLVGRVGAGDAGHRDRHPRVGLCVGAVSTARHLGHR